MPPKNKGKVNTAVANPKVLVANEVSAKAPKRKAPTAKATAAVPACSLLPACVNRVVNPGAPDQRRCNRTSEEVMAAASRKEAMRQEIAELEKLRMTKLVEMELEEEEEDEEEESFLIKNVADHERMDTTQFVAQLGGRMDLELECALDNFPFKETKASKRKAKGDVRNAVDATKEDIRQKKGVKERNQNRWNDDVLFVDSSETTPRHAPPMQPQPDIPAAITAIWDRTLIPTLLHALGSAMDPWDFTVKATIEVLRTVYPTSSYDMAAPRNLVLKRVTRDHLNNGRSWFGTQAILVVSKHFQDPKYSDLPAAEMKAKIRSEFLNVDEKGYQLPTASQDYGFLVGALCLAAAVLEKTFLMYETGEYIGDGLQFSRDNVSELVDDYLTNIGDFSRHKWEKIMERCGVAINRAQAPLPGEIGVIGHLPLHPTRLPLRHLPLLLRLSQPSVLCSHPRHPSTPYLIPPFGFYLLLPVQRLCPYSYHFILCPPSPPVLARCSTRHMVPG
ncbi:hypothetical protein B0H17DRAFT_1203613 [Mycena rosella]|uniref:Uncharacterized protein n=1 Tax=Mycena rosella TaxID=1033263 RepID=A0AAD7DE83_MYCRO|nr:hypothetical protein B0H17DRAFT_1203613 [Mycena rosella]